MLIKIAHLFKPLHRYPGTNTSISSSRLKGSKMHHVFFNKLRLASPQNSYVFTLFLVIWLSKVIIM